LSLLKWFRKRKAEALQRARQKAAHERQSAENTLKLDDWVSGFGPNPFRSEDEELPRASFSLDGDEDNREDY
jgi:hypothetical protein